MLSGICLISHDRFNGYQSVWSMCERHWFMKACVTLTAPQVCLARAVSHVWADAFIVWVTTCTSSMCCDTALVLQTPSLNVFFFVVCFLFHDLKKKCLMYYQYELYPHVQIVFGFCWRSVTMTLLLTILIKFRKAAELKLPTQLWAQHEPQTPDHMDFNQTHSSSLSEVQGIWGTLQNSTTDASVLGYF